MGTTDAVSANSIFGQNRKGSVVRRAQVGRLCCGSTFVARSLTEGCAFDIVLLDAGSYL